MQITDITTRCAFSYEPRAKALAEVWPLTDNPYLRGLPAWYTFVAFLSLISSFLFTTLRYYLPCTHSTLPHSLCLLSALRELVVGALTTCDFHNRHLQRLPTFALRIFPLYYTTAATGSLAFRTLVKQLYATLRVIISNMISFSYFQFFLCAIALFVTHASAYAPSNDTPTAEQVSCVYPISGQYGLLPRILFYASLVFAIFVQHFEWLVVGALASAMTFSATSAIHILIIFATHGRKPPILDLDALGIAMIAMVSVSLFPALVCFSSTLRRNRAGAAVVKFWFFMMVVTGILALIMVNDANRPPLSSNAEVACFLPDKTLLTSLAQLNGTRNLECIYDCFLTRGSVLKPQDAATVIFGAPASGTLGSWGLIICTISSGCMVYFGIIVSCMSSKKSFAKRYEAASEEVQMRPGYGPASDKEGYVFIGMMVVLGAVAWVPSIILIEFSIRNIPIEEDINAVGQWGPWVAATFVIIGSLIYRTFEPTDNKEDRDTTNAAPNAASVDPPMDDVISGKGRRRSYSMDDLSQRGRNDYTHASDEYPASRGSVDSYTQPPQRHHQEEETAYNRQTPAGSIRGMSSRGFTSYRNNGVRLYAVRGRSPSESNSAPYFNDEEADIGNYRTRMVRRGSSTSVEEGQLPDMYY